MLCYARVIEADIFVPFPDERAFLSGVEFFYAFAAGFLFFRALLLFFSVLAPNSPHINSFLVVYAKIPRAAAGLTIRETVLADILVIVELFLVRF